MNWLPMRHASGSVTTRKIRLRRSVVFRWRRQKRRTGKYKACVHRENGFSDSGRRWPRMKITIRTGTSVMVRIEENATESFFKEIALQRFDGCLNQSRPVITGENFDAGRKRRFDFAKLFLNAVDHLKRVHSVTHHNDSADGFPFAVPLRHTRADIGPERDASQVADKNRRAVLRSHGHGFKILQRTEVA